MSLYDFMFLEKDRDGEWLEVDVRFKLVGLLARFFVRDALYWMGFTATSWIKVSIFFFLGRRNRVLEW